MARQKFEKSFNTFVKGLMTEASELNFPEDFSLYEKNFLLHRDGGRDRRRGMELVYPLGMTLTSTLYPIEFDDSMQVLPAKVSHMHYRKQIQDGSGESDDASIAARMSWLRFRNLRSDVGAHELAQISSKLERMNFNSVLVSFGDTEPLTLDSKVDRLNFWVAAIDTNPDPESLALGVSVTRMYFHAP